jgi:DNA-binding transcriptional LysR family regulator
MLCSIADYGSLSKAASALGLAPSALTTQLQRIERSMGGLLFERDWRGARPTALGELVLSRSRAVLPAVRDLEDEVIRLVENGATATDSICRIGTAGSPVLSGIIRRLTGTETRRYVSVQPSSSPAELATMLAECRIDFALVGLCGGAAPPAHHELVWEDIAVDAVFVLLPADHHLAEADEVELADLRDVTWAAGGPYECCFGDCLAAACARAGFTMRGLYEVDVRTAIDLVEAGDAVALCQSSFRPPDGLVAVPIAGTPLRWRHIVGWLPANICTNAAQTLLDAARESYEEAVERIPRTKTWFAANSGFGLTPAATGSDHDRTNLQIT